MTPRKLSDSDKREILDQYRQPGETTVTLANRYGVSNSTISRILKSSFSDEEYKELVQHKRSANSASNVPDAAEVEEVEEPVELEIEAAPSLPVPKVRRRHRTSEATEADTQAIAQNAIQLELLQNLDLVNHSTVESLDKQSEAEVKVLEEMLGEEILDQEDFSDLDEDDDDLDDYNGDDLDDDDMPLPQRKVRPTGIIQVLPLSEATLPKTCYLVVDRAAELITRPLRDFGDLGEIPTLEIQQKTLPVFDNHRVARRFSNRSQRVVKVPDGRMLQKTSSYLQAKGITRLLIDGQVYSL
ncbi:transposase [Microcoleus sp. FACHB-672]|uniref:transposase n=1 Tax=Microcoleus sp. FACHB-672 TaxID=2692825 RepID=UPI00168742B0|nr:transposase [Microcoleus sp. FACHB-672]MBD2043250.1 transposase [Microcoleus sp. FACHB-672]